MVLVVVVFIFITVAGVVVVFAGLVAFVELEVLAAKIVGLAVYLTINFLCGWYLL